MTHRSSRLRRRRRRRAHRISRRRVFVEWGLCLVVAAGLVALARLFAFTPYLVPSASMSPTLAVGDRVLAETFLFHASSLREGDVVVFARPASDTVCGTNEAVFVKRVIGLPGETVSSADGRVEIDGRPLAEPYLPRHDPLGRAIQPLRLGADQYYVLGDDRSDSCDSRYWGPVPGGDMLGRVVLVFWHDGHPSADLL